MGRHRKSGQIPPHALLQQQPRCYQVKMAGQENVSHKKTLISLIEQKVD